jgi:hypothetical protein
MAGGGDLPVMMAEEDLRGIEEKDRLPVRYGIAGGSVGEHALAFCGIPPNRKRICTRLLRRTDKAHTRDFLYSVSSFLLAGACTVSTLFLFVRGSPSALSTACRFATADGPKYAASSLSFLRDCVLAREVGGSGAGADITV